MGQDSAVTIYISASSELRMERDTVARTVAELPVTVVWHVVQTPVGAGPLDRDALQDADLHLLVLGSDIRAPVGLELQVVRRAGRPSVAFLKQDVARTPAGQVFIKEAGVDWQPFGDVGDLRRQVRRVLARHLVRHASRYALSADEVDKLKAVLNETSADDVEPEEGGAGDSAVILSRKRFRPSEGVPLDDPDR